MQTYPDFFSEPHKLLNIDNTEPVLVALSGGADSTLLLHLLCDASRDLGFPLYAAHVNHNIRTDEYADEAARDENFCRALCEKLGIMLFVLNVDVPSLAKQSGKSLETAARDVRYDFFAETMRQNGIKILATAHNADDNLETQIFNLARGCGIEGICGIPQVRSFEGVDNGIIVRPILSATKAEVIALCESNSIDFVSDSTNFEDDCTRNRIRHNIIPELVALFGSPQKAALRLSDSARCDSDFLKKSAENALNGTDGNIDLETYNELHPAIKRRALALAFDRYASALGISVGLESVHISSLESLIGEAVPYSAISLPGRIKAVVKNGNLVFEKDEREKTVQPFFQTLYHGINFIADNPFAIYIGNDTPPEEIGGESDTNVYKLYTSTRIKSDKMLILSTRNRREGDLIRDGGMNKKVKKLLCDKKIPRELRDHLPVVCDGDEIIYLPACAVADRVKAHKGDDTIKISVYKKEQR